MSNYESTWGNGKLTAADFSKLKKLLVEASNKDLKKFTEKQLKNAGVKRPNSRTTNFCMVQSFGKDAYWFGDIILDKENKTFTFSVEENNRAVEDAKKTSVFSTLMRFISNIPEKGMKYGAVVYYDSEDFDGKKQVLTNDENTNNEVKTMENQKVMAKVASLYKESTSSRVRNAQLSVESSIIRQAFGIKNGEIDKAIKMLKEVENFNRKTILTDKQITEKYMEYIEFFKWAKATDSNSRYDAEIKLEYFVKGVEFFNKSLAEKLKQIAINQGPN